jgi:hypothetical protein
MESSGRSWHGINSSFKSGTFGLFYGCAPIASASLTTNKPFPLIAPYHHFLGDHKCPKKSAAVDFNMSETIRELLTENSKLTSTEVADAIVAKHPGAIINKNSFAVAFYTIRKKLGIGSSRRGRRVRVRVAKAEARKSVRRSTVDFAMLQSAAKFLAEVGGAEAALEAIKQVQAVQVK